MMMVVMMMVVMCLVNSEVVNPAVKPAVEVDDRVQTVVSQHKIKVTQCTVYYYCDSIVCVDAIHVTVSNVEADITPHICCRPFMIILDKVLAIHDGWSHCNSASPHLVSSNCHLR